MTCRHALLHPGQTNRIGKCNKTKNSVENLKEKKMKTIFKVSDEIQIAFESDAFVPSKYEAQEIMWTSYTRTVKLPPSMFSELQRRFTCNDLFKPRTIEEKY